MDYNKKNVEDIDVAGKKVIVRCDFNVPQDETAASPMTSASWLRCPPSSICSSIRLL